MENAATLRIDLAAKDNDGLTGFHNACKTGLTYFVKKLMKKAATFGLNLDTKKLIAIF